MADSSITLEGHPAVPVKLIDIGGGLFALATSGSTGASGPVTDSGPTWTSAHGIAGVPFTSADQHSAVAVCTSAPTSGQKLVITDLIISVDTACKVTLTEETSGTVVWGPHYLTAGIHQNTTRSRFFKLATANKKLAVQTDIAAFITVDAFYYSEA